MRIDRMGDKLNEWGEPVAELEKKKITESFDDKVLKRYRHEESQKESLAESKLNAVEFRLNKIHHQLLNGRISVSLVEASFSDQAKFQVKLFGPGKVDFKSLHESLKRHGYDSKFLNLGEREFQIKLSYESQLDEKLVERLVSFCVL